MRQKGTLSKNTPVPNQSGGMTDVYTDVCTFRGQLLQKSSSRTNEQGELVNNRNFQFITRAQNALVIDPGSRLIIDGTSYSILSYELVDQIKQWYKFILSKNG